MNVDVHVILSEDIPESAAPAIAFVALLEALIGRAKDMGLTKEQLMERLPKAIESAWEPSTLQ